EEDAPLADVRLVGADRGVGGDEQGVVAEPAQRRDEGVVAHATAAVHAGAGGDERDPHGRHGSRVPPATLAGIPPAGERLSARVTRIAAVGDRVRWAV